MKKIIIIFSFLLFFLLSSFLLTNNIHAKMYIESQDLKEGEMLKMAQVYNGCGGDNISPQITVKDIPKETKSLAITAYDPDAPTGSGWWHWIVFNIPAYVTNIPAGDKKIADGVAFGKNDYGTHGYGGACPPIGHGKHRYIFTVYALKVEKLDVAPGSSGAMIGFNINANAIDQASITAYFERK